ncbi:MAG: hypothetical protein Ct9H300mP10_05250 [Methanobacteriota archaeon]|nr:MAG: hypothetical protein Ct9H300mP10_05250 [Euryarchaeota archaeon]
MDQVLSILPSEQPVLCGGWAIRHWRYDGWPPLRSSLFCTVQDTDASLHHYLSTGQWGNRKRTPEQWSEWALHGASSKAVTNHPDLESPKGSPGPLTYEIELYQGCVRFKRAASSASSQRRDCHFGGTRTTCGPEIATALTPESGTSGWAGPRKIYTYHAQGVEDLEYPIPDPEPIARVLHGAREDERLEILHVDNANPSIVAESIEPATEITKTFGRDPV